MIPVGDIFFCLKETILYKQNWEHRSSDLHKSHVVSLNVKLLLNRGRILWNHFSQYERYSSTSKILSMEDGFMIRKLPADHSRQFHPKSKFFIEYGWRIFVFHIQPNISDFFGLCLYFSNLTQKKIGKGGGTLLAKSS